MIASVLGGEGTVADTTQNPEKTEVFTPTTDPNAAAFGGACGSVPEEVPADSLPEETVPADQPADAEQPADTQPQEPEAPAEGETGSGDTAGEHRPSPCPHRKRWNRLHRPSTMRLPPSGVPFRMLRSRTTRPDDLKYPLRKLRTLSRKYYFICKTGNDCGHFLFCFFPESPCR